VFGPPEHFTINPSIIIEQVPITYITTPTMSIEFTLYPKNSEIINCHCEKYKLMIPFSKD